MVHTSAPPIRKIAQIWQHRVTEWLYRDSDGGRTRSIYDFKKLKEEMSVCGGKNTKGERAQSRRVHLNKAA